jgi:alpha-tubulin suppressor-like RCC1 family protein
MGPRGQRATEFTLHKIPFNQKILKFSSGLEHSIIWAEDGHFYGTGSNSNFSLGVPDNEMYVLLRII